MTANAKTVGVQKPDEAKGLPRRAHRVQARLRLNDVHLAPEDVMSNRARLSPYRYLQ